MTETQLVNLVLKKLSSEGAILYSLPLGREIVKRLAKRVAQILIKKGYLDLNAYNQ